MSDTPRTDANGLTHLVSVPELEWVDADFARQLERELAEAKNERVCKTCGLRITPHQCDFPPEF